MCSIQPPTSWSPRFPSRHSRSCLTLKSPLSFTLLISASVCLSLKEMERAVESAKSAFSTWSKTTPLARQQVEGTWFYPKFTNWPNDQPPDYVQVPATDKREPVWDSKAYHSGAGISFFPIFGEENKWFPRAKHTKTQREMWWEAYR